MAEETASKLFISVINATQF